MPSLGSDVGLGTGPGTQVSRISVVFPPPKIMNVAPLRFCPSISPAMPVGRRAENGENLLCPPPIGRRWAGIAPHTVGL